MPTVFPFRPLSLVLLAALTAGPAMAAGFRYGVIYISDDEPINPTQSWRVKISDVVEKQKDTYPFGGNAYGKPNAKQYSRLDSPAGSFRIWETRKSPSSASSPGVEILPNDMEFEIKTRTYYTVAFPYATVGLQTFKHVIELRSWATSGALIRLEAGKYSTGATLNCEINSQADASGAPGNERLDPGVNTRYLYHIRNNGNLVKEEPLLSGRAGAPPDAAIFIYVQKHP
jgi:hypothetical protein